MKSARDVDETYENEAVETSDLESKEAKEEGIRGVSGARGRPNEKGRGLKGREIELTN